MSPSNLFPRHATAALSAAVLAACSGAPSEGDIRSALERQQQAEAAATPARMKAVVPQVEITGLKKLGCESAGEKAWRCDVEVTVQAMGRVVTSATKLRLVRGSEGWMVSH